MNCPDCNGGLRLASDEDQDGSGAVVVEDRYRCTNCGAIWSNEDLRTASYEHILGDDDGDNALDFEREG